MRRSYAKQSACAAHVSSRGHGHRRRLSGATAWGAEARLSLIEMLPCDKPISVIYLPRQVRERLGRHTNDRVIIGFVRILCQAKYPLLKVTRRFFASLQAPTLWYNTHNRGSCSTSYPSFHTFRRRRFVSTSSAQFAIIRSGDDAARPTKRDAPMSKPGSPTPETDVTESAVASPRLSVLMPVYNEEETVEAIIADVLAVPIDLELIVVDDGSTDTTRSLLGKIEADPRLKIIYAPYNVGKGAAIRVALSHATGEVIVIQDADREYDPMDFVPMLDLIDRGAAGVYVTRLSKEAMSLNNEGRHDKFYYARRVLPFLTNMIFGTALTAEATCFLLFRRVVLFSFSLRCVRFVFCFL